jgi:hypothetical protein
VKTGAEADVKWDGSPGSFTAFWDRMHLPGCKYVAMTPEEKLDDFMENGSPVSSEG